MNITEDQLRIVIEGFNTHDVVMDQVRNVFSAISSENQVVSTMPYEMSRAVDELLLCALGTSSAVETFYWYVYDTEYGTRDARVIIDSVEHNIDSVGKLFDLLSNKPIRE